MSPEQQQHMERMGFREWTEHYEKEQEIQRDQIGDLTKAVSSLTADVRTLVDNQKGLFGRINRPPPVAAYVSALLASIAVMISFSTLLVGPIKEEIDHMQASALRESTHNTLLHEQIQEDVERTIERTATVTEASRWLEKLDDRFWDVQHGSRGGTRP